jgi:BlaI family penicillinase repressor
MVRLSDFELEVLHLLWQFGEASTPELHQAISTERDLAYSTVRTIVSRLEQKGAIERCDQKGRALTFRPLISQEQASKSLIKSFVKKTFAGKSRPLLNHLLEAEALSREDIEYLESILARKKRDLVQRDD